MFGRFTRFFPSTGISNAIRQLTVHEGFLETDIRLKHLPANSTALTIAIYLGKQFTPEEWKAALKFTQEVDRHLKNKDKLLTNALLDVMIQKNWATFGKHIQENKDFILTLISIAVLLYQTENDNTFVKRVGTSMSGILSDLWNRLPSEEELDKELENKAPSYRPRG